MALLCQLVNLHLRVQHSIGRVARVMCIGEQHCVACLQLSFVAGSARIALLYKWCRVPADIEVPAKNLVHEVLSSTSETRVRHAATRVFDSALSFRGLHVPLRAGLASPA